MLSLFIDVFYILLVGHKEKIDKPLILKKISINQWDTLANNLVRNIIIIPRSTSKTKSNHFSIIWHHFKRHAFAQVWILTCHSLCIYSWYEKSANLEKNIADLKKSSLSPVHWTGGTCLEKRLIFRVIWYSRMVRNRCSSAKNQHQG